MSTVARSVKVGTVARDSAMRRAISACVRVGSVTVTSPLAVPGSRIICVDRRIGRSPTRPGASSASTTLCSAVVFLGWARYSSSRLRTVSPGRATLTSRRWRFPSRSPGMPSTPRR